MYEKETEKRKRQNLVTNKRQRLKTERLIVEDEERGSKTLKPSTAVISFFFKFPLIWSLVGENIQKACDVIKTSMM